MYEAPIKLIMGQLRDQVDGEIFKAIQDINVQVDKDELTKALQYDRGQYDEGYADGYKEAIREFAEKLKTEIAGLEVKSPSITYKCGIEYALYYRMPKIIDRLVEEMGCNDG